MSFKKVIAREGLILLALAVPSILFYYAQMYFFHTGSQNDKEWVYLYWGPRIVTTVLILYTTYWTARFIIWAIRTVKNG
jgi:surface polysaccharide O-acyltransferase-like enzyme